MFIFKKIFEDCFIKSLEEYLKNDLFNEKFEKPWRKLIQYVFKQYTDGINFEKLEDKKCLGVKINFGILVF